MSSGSRDDEQLRAADARVLADRPLSQPSVALLTLGHRLRLSLSGLLFHKTTLYVCGALAVLLILAGIEGFRRESVYRHDQVSASRLIRVAQNAAVGVLGRAKDGEIAVLDALLGDSPHQQARRENWIVSRGVSRQLQDILLRAEGLPPQQAEIARELAGAASEVIAMADHYMQQEALAGAIDEDAGERMAQASSNLRMLSSETVATLQAFHDDVRHAAVENQEVLISRAVGLLIAALGAMLVVAVGWRARTQESEEALQLAYQAAQLYPLTWNRSTGGILDLHCSAADLLARLGVSSPFTKGGLLAAATQESQAAFSAAITAADAGQPIDTLVEFKSADGRANLFLKIVLRRKRFGNGRSVMTGFVQNVTSQVKGAQTREIALAESKHRMANLIHLVRGVATRTVRRHGADQAIFLSVLEGRMNAIMRAQTMLLNSGRSSSLQEAVAAALQGWEGEMDGRCSFVTRAAVRQQETVTGALPETARFPDNAWEVLLTGDQAKAIVLILHELSMNATKYGAFTSSAGTLRISADWTDGMVVLIWSESGGPPPSGDRVPGYGSRLLKVLANDLGAGGGVHQAYDDQGMRVEIRLAPQDSVIDSIGDTVRVA